MKHWFQVKRGLSVYLEKRIPMCAGMGGGSSDAVTIRALNQLWLLTLSRKDMMDIGIPIGSDVPYCLLSGCAQVTGKGEVVCRILGLLSSWVVLVKPDFGISTWTIFLDINCKIISRVSTTHLVVAIEAGNYNDGILTEMNNLLEDIFIAKRPFIQKIKEKTLQAGAATALMTGSGPTVFALCQTEKQTIIV